MAEDSTFGFEDLEKAFKRIEQKYPNKTDAMLMAMARVAANRTKGKTPVGKTKKLKGTWRTKKPKVYGKARVARMQSASRYSINADATHFVHCEGKIHIHDCYFEGQLDDALNVHSIYLKIVNKFDNTLLLKQVHCEQAGINIVAPGDVLQSADPDSLIPNGEYKVVSVKRINLELLEVKVEGDISCVRIGDVVDEISHVPEVLFENCTMVNNRARSMLLASHGKIVIRNNIFKSAGPAIMFEANGNFWYEAGGTKDVLITGNVFDGCKYSYFWSDSVITVVPRKKIEEGKYYHKKIAVVDNTFRSCNAILVSANNVENFIFKGNEIVSQEMPLYDTVHCKTVETDM